MLNVNQKAMKHYRVVSNKKEDRYFFVSEDLIKKVPLTDAHEGKLEILKVDDPTAKQMLEESDMAPLIDYRHLVCESEHYLFRCTFRKAWYDWEVLKK